jgi:hypothetical protein
MYKRKQPTFDEALAALSSTGFEIASAPRVPGCLVRKYGCAAGLANDPDLNRPRVTLKPGYLIGGEIARLVDKGYQKFLSTSKIEVPATADHLKAIHQFSEELKESTGLTSLYNESLGTVSDRYVYDRVEGRDEEHPATRPWQKSRVS